MVKSETHLDAEILVRNPSPRLFGKKFRDSKKVKTNHAKTRLRNLSKTLPRFRDPAKIFRDPRFSRYHSPPIGLYCEASALSKRGIFFRLQVYERGWGGILIFEVYERLLKQSLVPSGAHNRERLTSILRLCNDVFTSRSIFR